MSDHEPCDEEDAGFLARELEWEGQRLPYVVHRQPDFRARERWPVIVFLHGLGQCGDDGMDHIRVGLPPLLHQHPEDWPFVSILPQKPLPEQEWSDLEGAILAMVERAVDMDRADLGRVHLTGLSQGGHGALRLGAAHPERWRTVSAICPYVAPPLEGWSADAPAGSWPTDLEAAAEALAEGLRGTPTWLLHGSADEAVPVSHSLALHEALQPRNPEARLTIYPGAGHEVWTPAYAMEGLWRWMESQQL